MDTGNQSCASDLECVPVSELRSQTGDTQRATVTLSRDLRGKRRKIACMNLAREEDTSGQHRHHRPQRELFHRSLARSWGTSFVFCASMNLLAQPSRGDEGRGHYLLCRLRLQMSAR